MPKVCPICAAVAGSWLVLTALILAGALKAEVFLPLVLLLMGGSAVGIAYQGEKSFPWAGRHPLLWKSVSIGAGMSLAFWAARNLSFRVLVLEFLAMAAFAYLFFAREQSARPPKSWRTRELEEKMKDCC
ncbi:MAG: hypothetical protein Q8Q97_02475 [bacterium]|nr:hypothetical protein [bacterium]